MRNLLLLFSAMSVVSGTVVAQGLTQKEETAIEAKVAQEVLTEAERARIEARTAYEANLLEAQADDPVAQYRVAVALYKGLGVKEDKIESAYWLQRSARHNYKQAISRLAWHFRNGVGVIQNIPQSEKYYKQAYRMGVVGSSIPLSAIYRTGEGRSVEDGGTGRVRENHAEAVRWALIAAEVGIARGQNILGELYRDGVGVKQDFGTALEWFEKAAAQDLGQAFYNASVIFRAEDLGYYDPDKGIEYLKFAADKGHASAMIDLALSYAAGTGVEQNYDLALAWYSKAAARNTRSAVKLAKAYEEGVFGAPDPVRAYKWYFIARESGEVTGIVGAIATRDKISAADQEAMEVEGREWIRETQG